MNILPEVAPLPPGTWYLAWYPKYRPGRIQVGRVVTWLPNKHCDSVPLVVTYPTGQLEGVDLCQSEVYVGQTPDQALKAAEQALEKAGKRP